MTTVAEVRKAEALCRRQAMAGQKLLRIDAGKATAREIEIHARALAAADFEKAIADPEVNKLFCRGVLFFGRDRCR